MATLNAVWIGSGDNNDDVANAKTELLVLVIKDKADPPPRCLFRCSSRLGGSDDDDDDDKSNVHDLQVVVVGWILMVTRLIVGDFGWRKARDCPARNIVTISIITIHFGINIVLSVFRTLPFWEKYIIYYILYTVTVVCHETSRVRMLNKSTRPEDNLRCFKRSRLKS